MEKIVIRVIEISDQGKTLYVAANSCLSPQPAVPNPANAINFADLPEIELHHALSSIAVRPGDDYWAKSGIRSDTLPQVVEFEVQVSELSRRQGRDFHKAYPVENSQ
jgi:hypothetical protein